MLYTDSIWQNDILGDGFEMRQETLPNNENSKKFTIIKKCCKNKSKYSILYIHGYNDYFFQTEMANMFITHGFNFYAIDLIGYGRSITKNEIPFEIKDLTEYYPIIDYVLSIMNNNNITDVILLGHSTGGLIAASYINDLNPNIVKGVILNSPFLDWNLNYFLKKIAIPIISIIGKYIPNISIKQPSTKPYSESLLKEFHGEWDYNISWKFIQAPNVSSQWIRAISIAQKRLRKKSKITIPILLMHSDNSVYGNHWNESFNRGDAILNVYDINKYGRKLGKNITIEVFNNALHDLVLSSKEIRNNVYDAIFNWIKDKITS